MQDKITDSNHYQHPLIDRYASPEMARIFSPHTKYSTWRQLWVALAEAEMELGLPITKQQIDELKSKVDTIDLANARQHENRLGHDVMAHIHAFADQCPAARPILHLGATSCYVTDNGDLIQMKQGLQLLQKKLKNVIGLLADFCRKYKERPCLGYTHLQPAQLTTVGKRAALWLQDLLMDYEELSYRLRHLKFLGAKGATGTQASYLKLFERDAAKTERLDELIAEKMGFEAVFPITAQTYTRKQDTFIVNALAGLAASCHKCGTDIRLLCGLKEMSESFTEEQVGSSAMPYKRNPILTERLCSLSRYLIALSQNPAYTHALQWLERSLDDSANRRMTLPEAFLSADALLMLMENILQGLSLHPAVIDRHIKQELPFLATENILMASVTQGKDRQTLHEKLKQHSFAAAQKMHESGEENDLLERIANDPDFPLEAAEILQLVTVKNFIGRAPEQVDAILKITEETVC